MSVILPIQNKCDKPVCFIYWGIHTIIHPIHISIVTPISLRSEEWDSVQKNQQQNVAFCMFGWGRHIGLLQAAGFAGALPKPRDEVVVCRKSDDNPQNSLHLIIVERMNLREIRMVGCVLCMWVQATGEKRKVECVLCMSKIRKQTTGETLKCMG